MQNVLPQQAGLTVGNVVYRYETVKNTEDDMVVYVQNENSAGDGYIFRERDDWSGLPGNKIYKVVGVQYSTLLSFIAINMIPVSTHKQTLAALGTRYPMIPHLYQQ
jgi:hypothetical protein